MDLIINNHIIDGDVIEILSEIRRITDGRYVKDIIKRGDNVGVTCPFHKDGQENHPSCYVYLRKDNPDVPYGFYKCFTCGSQGNLDYLVAHCLNCSIEDAREWLINNYSTALSEQVGINLPEIEIGHKPEKIEYIDESFLDQFAYFHPYMFQRKLSKDIILKFKIGWNPITDAITFPIWDEYGRLVGISERKVKYKQFNLPKNLSKQIYLLDTIKEENITEVYVVESQIDALYLWSLGYPAIALFGTGSKEQYKMLQKSGIRFYHLALDGDMAGRHGIMRFIKAMPENIFIDICLIPDGKDINDLSKEEIENLSRVDRNNYLQTQLY